MSFSKPVGILLLLILICAGSLAAQDPCSGFPPPPFPVSVTLDQTEIIGNGVVHGVVSVNDLCGRGGLIHIFVNPSSAAVVIGAQVQPGAGSAGEHSSRCLSRLPPLPNFARLTRWCR